MDKEKLEQIRAWSMLVILMLIPVACVIGMAIIEDKHDDQTWASDTANKLNESGGSIYMTDGTYIRVFAHLTSTTSVEYRNGAFYVTNPNNSNLGLYVVPIDHVKWVSTVSS